MEGQEEVVQLRLKHLETLHHLHLDLALVAGCPDLTAGWQEEFVIRLDHYLVRCVDIELVMEPVVVALRDYEVVDQLLMFPQEFHNVGEYHKRAGLLILAC